VNYVYIDDVYIPSEIRLESSAEIKVMGIKSKAFQYSTELKFSKLNEFRIASSTSNITAICEN
jgi:predicted nucleotidyltransferase